MNLYGVDGIRHQAVAFGATPEEAMAQALANGEVDDRQLAQFKADPLNHGKVMNRGVWRYTRHPNYFGDAAQWWGYGSSRSRRAAGGRFSAPSSRRRCSCACRIWRCSKRRWRQNRVQRVHPDDERICAVVSLQAGVKRKTCNVI
jgi:hypothetical protein